MIEIAATGFLAVTIVQYLVVRAHQRERRYFQALVLRSLQQRDIAYSFLDDHSRTQVDKIFRNLS